MSRDGYALISYHNLDVQFALQLATDLRNNGVNVWLDRLDVRGDSDWNAANHTALAECSVMIALLSPDYAVSQFGRMALARASSNSVTIVPVLVRPLDVEQYPTQVDYRQYISMVNWQSDSVYASSFGRLLEMLRNTKSVTITKLLNPEVRYVHELNRLVEAHKALLEATRLAYLNLTEDDSDAVTVIPPRPRLEESWGLNGLFLSRGVLMQENIIISDLLRWTKSNPRFVLIGGRGVGKTTTLMRLMSEHIRAYLDNPKHTPVPFWVDLSRWDPDVDLMKFIAHQWMLKSDPIPDMVSGRIIVFIDGIDELGIYTSIKAQRLREWLNGKQAPQRVVVACDNAKYSNDYSFHLPVISLEEMNDSRLREQASVYMGRDSHEFLERVAQHDMWKWWVRNPFLLRMLMFCVRQRPEKELPTNPEQLILDVVELLWEREQIFSNPDWVPTQEMLPKLALFAYRILFKGTPHSITPEQARQYLPSEGLLYALISANILRNVHQRVRFWHRSVLDVLAALHLQTETIHAHLAYTEFDESGRRISHHWDHVLIALSGILEDPEPMLLHIADVDPYLALDCLRGRQIREELRQTLVVRFMRYAITQQTAHHQATFALLQDVSFGDVLGYILPFLRYGDWETRVIAHQFLLMCNFAVAQDLQDGLQQWDGTSSDEVAHYFRQIGVEAIPPLLRLLNSPIPTVRRGALWGLGIMADRACIVGAVQLLEDAESTVRLQAIELLRDLPDASVVSFIIERLRDTDWSIRKVATETLSLIGSSSVPLLRKMLDSSNEDAKRIAIGVLGRVGDVSVVTDILPYVKDPKTDLRAIAVISLGQIGDELAVPDLATCAGDEQRPKWSKYTISELALKALEQIGTESAMSIIKRFFQRVQDTGSAKIVSERLKQDTQVKAPFHASEEEIAPSTPPMPTFNEPILHPGLDDSADTLDSLLRGLHSPDWDVRQQAAKQLRVFAQNNQKVFNPRVVRRLEAGLFDEDDFVRWATVEALAFIGDPTLVPALMNMLQDTVWTVRLAVIRALAEIGDPRCLPDLAERLSDDNTMVREVTVEVLGQFRRSEAIPALLGALNDKEPFIRRGAVQALGNIGDLSVSDKIIALLEEDDYQMRWTAVEALGKLRDPASVSALIEHLNETYQLPYEDALTLGDLVVTTLEQIGTREALEAVIKRQSGL